MERKAHMNIHDVIDVAQDEARKLERASGSTRDRFGKNHEIPAEGRVLKILALLFLLSAATPAWASRATDTRVESSNSDLFDSVNRKEPGASLDFYSDGSTRVGIDENGAGLRNRF